MLQHIEPFGFGYINCHGDVNKKIAAGMYNLCKYFPLTIDPEIGLASIDQSDDALINHIGVTYECGNGIVARPEAFDREIEMYPEYAAELQAMKDLFVPLTTYTIFKNGYTLQEKMLSDTNTLWGGTWGGHSNPDYGLLIRLGTDGLREKIDHYRQEHPEKGEWYDDLLTVLDGIDILGQRFRELALEKAEEDAENKAIYLKIAKAFETIPQKPANDFMTACQLFYLVFSLDGRDSPGSFDQYMGPYFEMTERTEARRTLEGLWQGFHKTRAWNLCIGGSDENWNDLSNDLTYEILDVARKYQYNTPNLTMRCHRNTPPALLRKAAQTIGSGVCMPALYNDEVVCPALEALGIPAEDSHLYAMNGCNQFDIQGKSHMGLEDGEICLLKCLEYALFDGKCLLTDEYVGLRTGDAERFASFDDLMKAFRAQVTNAIQATTRLANKSQKIFAEYAPNPLRSILIQGCIEKGLGYKSGGPIYNHGQILTEGLADTADSLIAIKHFVYDTSTYSMGELLEALRTDYEGRDDMRLKLRNYAEKFGNDRDEVDQLCSTILGEYFTELMQYRTYRDPINGIYGGGLSTFQRTGRYGGSCGASANGRHSRDGNIADSIGATPGMDENGPTAVIKSALRYPQQLAKSGFVLQLKFDKQMFNTESGLNGFIGLVHAYFDNGGQQLTINVLSQEELLDAQKCPDRHRGLLVRVGGYTDYFVNLSEDLQSNIIARTVNSI